MSVSMQLFSVVSRDDSKNVRQVLEPLSEVSQNYRRHSIVFQPSLLERGKSRLGDVRVFREQVGEALHQRGNSIVPTSGSGQWTLRVQGHAALVAQHQTLCRSIEDISISHNFANLLSFVDFRLAHETLQKGTVFSVDENTCIRLFQLYKLTKPRDLDSTVLLDQDQYVLELFMTAPRDADPQPHENALVQIARSIESATGIQFVKLNPAAMMKQAH